MKNSAILDLLVLGPFFLTMPLSGFQGRDVVINEIAWMGTDASSSDEWIELYNNTAASIDLSGWTLAATDGDPAVVLSGIVPAHGYFLLERTDDNTVSDLTADQVYSGNLGNAGEILELKDPSALLIDRVGCSGGWFGGTSSPKATMERCHPNIDGDSASSWATNNGVTVNGTDASGGPVHGTPKSFNSMYDISLSVMLSSLSAFESEGSVKVCWTTASEVETRGFHVWRSGSEKGPFTRMTTALIESRGYNSTGADYEFVDRSVQPGGRYWYEVQEVEVSGYTRIVGSVSISVSLGQGAPDRSLLFGNYPNPFNPDTRIDYVLSRVHSEQPAALRVYNCLGQVVATLMEAKQTPGMHSVWWDGCDGQGKDVSSGLYVCRLFSGEESLDLKRMLKVK